MNSLFVTVTTVVLSPVLYAVTLDNEYPVDSFIVNVIVSPICALFVLLAVAVPLPVTLTVTV